MTSSAGAQRAAELLWRRRDTALRPFVRAASVQARRMRMAVLESVRRHGDPGALVGQAASRLRPSLVDLMLASHLFARGHAARVAPFAPVPLSMSLSPLTSTLDGIRRDLRLSPEDTVVLAAQYDTQARATIEKLAEAIRSRVGRATAEAIKRGIPTRRAVVLVGKALDNMGLDPADPRLIETVYRTQAAIAFSAGQWNANQAPEVREILWGYEYTTVGDDRVRPNHAALDGVRLPKDDPRWNRIMPPCGWNCRCSVLEIYKGDRLARAKPPREGQITVDGIKTTAEPDAGWGFNPGIVFPDTLPLRLPVRKVA